MPGVHGTRKITYASVSDAVWPRTGFAAGQKRWRDEGVPRGPGAFSHRRMSLNRGNAVGSREFLSVLVLREEEIVVGAVEMWESRQRFPRAVGNEGKPGFGFPRFPSARHFHGAPEFGIGDQALNLAMVAISCRLARCISRAASVSDWTWANRFSSAMLTLGRK